MDCKGSVLTPCRSQKPKGTNGSQERRRRKLAKVQRILEVDDERLQEHPEDDEGSDAQIDKIQNQHFVELLPRESYT
jgi:hypothetical protein